MKQCKCGSYAFNLYKEDIDQGNLCDVHYWKEKALAQPAVAEQHKQEPCKTCGGAGEVETGIGMMMCDDCKGITYTTPPQLKPLTDWVNVDERLPEQGGYYLVTVDTDEGPHVDVLLFSVKENNWIHEGEPTFCHSYYFEPTHWAHRPEAAHGIKE